MDADAVARCVAGTSVAMVMIMQDKRTVMTRRDFNHPRPSVLTGAGEYKYISIFPETDSARQRFHNIIYAFISS